MIELLELPFFRSALGAGLLVAVMLSAMGVYVVMRRIVFVGAGLAQVSAAGVALGALLGLHPDATALGATLVGVGLLSIRPKRVAMPSEGAIGIGYAAASTLAILFIARAPGGESDTLLLLYGNILAVTPGHLAVLAVACPVLVGIHVLFRREFVLVSYNPTTAQAAGVPVWSWNLLLYVTLGFGIATGIHVAGSLLTFTALVIPPLAALMLARRSWQIAWLSVGIAVAGTIAGVYASVLWDLPTGPTIVAALVAAIAPAWLLARLRA